MATTFNLDEAAMQSLEGALDEAMGNYADAIAANARSRAPRLTGELAGSIGVAKADEPMAYRIEANAPYAAFVELGTADTPAEPFLYPALRSTSVKPFLSGVLEQASAGGQTARARRSVRPSASTKTRLAKAKAAKAAARA